MMLESASFWWLGQHLLMATALAVVVLLACRLFRLSPAARHILWLLVLCRLVVPSVGIWPWSIPVGFPPEKEPPPLQQYDGISMLADVVETRTPSRIPEFLMLDVVDAPTVFDERSKNPDSTSAAPHGDDTTATIPPLIASGQRPSVESFWPPVLVGFWMLGSAVVVMVLIVRIHRIRRVLRAGHPVEPWLQRDIAEWCQRIGVPTPQCVVTGRFRSPFLWCLGRVRLIWPRALADPQQREQSRPIVVHELAHLKRRDHWTAWVELVAMAIWWWNPLFWFVRWQLRTASEMACDAWVVNLLPDERREYAESLIEFNSRLPETRFAVGVMGANPGSRRTFEKRLEMIMTAQIPARFSKKTLVAALLLGLLSLPAFSTQPESEAPDEAVSAAAVGDALSPPSDAASALDESGEPVGEAQDSILDSQLDTEPPVESAPGDAVGGNRVPFTGVQELLEQIESNYYGPVDRRQLEQAAIEAILSSLDGEAQVLSPEQLEEMLVNVDGNLAGVGIALHIDSELELPVVTRPILRSPAQAAGIRPGDVILAVNGESTEAMALSDMVDRIRGPIGSTVTLSIRRADQTQDIDVTREQFAVSHVEPWSVSVEGHENYWIDSDAGIGYVHIPTFTRQTGSQLRQILTDLDAEGLKGLVLDLRGCPGGLLIAATEVADLFIDDGIVVSSRGRDASNDMTVHASSDGTFNDLRVAVLVNGSTTSAAEIVAACLQDHHRAAIVGERTFGRGIVQALFPLNSGGALKLTTASWLRPNGRTLQRREGQEHWGVQPDPGLEAPLSNEERQRLDDFRQQLLAGAPVDMDDDPQLKIAIGALQL